MQPGNGSIIGKQNTPTNLVASGVWAMNEVQRAVLTSTWPLVVSADPLFEYVTMLLPGNGTNGAQNNTFLDSSTNNFTITRNGNTTQGSFSPYQPEGYWSNYFDGSGDYLTVASAPELSFGTGQYTVELWAYITSIGGFGTFFYTDLTGGFIFSANDTNPQQLTIGRQNQAVELAGGSIPLNTWTHFAATRDASNVTRLFINGQIVASGTITTNYPQGVSSINRSDTSLAGYFSNMRVVKGTAVYTSNFTPSTAPLTAISGTSLLTCQSNRFRDASTNNFAITVNGNPSVQRFSPFAPSAAYSTATNGGSGYFPSAGSTALVCGSSSNLALGSGNFTVELWTYVEALAPSYSVFLDWRTAGSYGLYYPILGDFNNNGKLTFTYSSNNSSFTTVVESSVSIPLKQWLHIAVVRNGSTVTMYFNGNSVGSGSDSSTFANQTLNVGNPQASNYTPNAYISDVRIVKGSAVYTGSFTPPAAPLTAITNTQLLLNFTNAGIIDNAMMNDLETVGNAQISTTQSKFGGSSLYFDGSGDWLTSYAALAKEFGSGAFTIECWAYITDNSTRKYIIGAGTSTVTHYNFALELGDNGKVNMWASSNGTSWDLITSDTSEGVGSTTIPLNQWNHVAMVRESNGTFKSYLNGVLQCTVSGKTGAIVSQPTTPFNVGKSAYTGSFGNFNGYIDDLRITKGYARYTANFTPPTAPFPTN